MALPPHFTTLDSTGRFVINHALRDSYEDILSCAVLKFNHYKDENGSERIWVQQDLDGCPQIADDPRILDWLDRAKNDTLLGPVIERTRHVLYGRTPSSPRSSADANIQSIFALKIHRPAKQCLLGAGRDRVQARPNPNPHRTKGTPTRPDTTNANSGLHANIAIGRVTADGVLELSCFNTPTSIAVSGTAAAFDEVIALGKSEGLFAQRIRTMVAGHSSFMDPIKDVYLAKIDDNFARYPMRPRSPSSQSAEMNTS
ncbi:hypothetical protein K438DRAFT_2022998 [Mycena galopus ATCC 62051]|nr:hypothetical protein K438DRAFT_2022998 [Mycena galopus ATCC 62051]